MYDIHATSETPMLIIYLIDVSLSMNEPMAGKTRLAVVSDALEAVRTRMIWRSTKGSLIASRYRVAMYPYSEQVYDVYEGIKSIAEIAKFPLPKLTAMRVTDTAKAFRHAKRILEQELPRMANHPAPLVCHLTDGTFTGDDPEPPAREIMQLEIPDGPVLVENIFVSDDILPEPVKDATCWPGVRPQTQLTNRYAIQLRRMSSPVPHSYRVMMEEMGYGIAQDAVMMFPGNSPGLLEMAFQMSAATRTR